MGREEMIKMLELCKFEKEATDTRDKFYYNYGKVKILFHDDGFTMYTLTSDGSMNSFEEHPIPELACIIYYAQNGIYHNEFKKLLSVHKLGLETIAYLRQFRGLDDPAIYGYDCYTKSQMYLGIIAILFNIDSDAGILECEEAFKR